MSRRKQNCPKRMKWESEGQEPPPGADMPGLDSADQDEDEDDEGASSAASLSEAASPFSGQQEEINRDSTMLTEAVSPPYSRCSSIPPRCSSRDSAVSERDVSPPISPISIAPPPPFIAAPQVHQKLLPPASPSVSPSPPPRNESPPFSNSPEDSNALDFSTKRPSEPVNMLSLPKLPPSAPPPPPAEVPLNSPLDLSCSSRKRSHGDESSPSSSPSPQPKKMHGTPLEFKQVVAPWTSPVFQTHFPSFAAAIAAASSLSPKSNNSSANENLIWNGKIKSQEKAPFGAQPAPSDATKALEKMSELSKLGGDEFRSFNNNSSSINNNNNSHLGSSGRHSAWQSHWLNKGAEQAKDVLKCVWCKQSFPSLAAMTNHMKEAKHCGVNVPIPQIQPPLPPQPQQTPPAGNISNNINSPPTGTNSKSNSSDLNLIIKETMPLPRKLVRGQDVWLGKGAEQTRQILKCMWCGQSFRSLAEMTSHMQQTQHYTNIISQEQIISWKSADDGKSSSSGSSGGVSSSAPGGTSSVTSSHVSAVLTCKVCDQAFSSLKDLSNHMVKNSHYKEHIMRSITESGGRRRQTREKRKKSLPVRKLLELERAQNDMKNGESMMMLGKHNQAIHAASRITCEKCGEKIDMAVFVDHIRLCIGSGQISSDHRNLLKNALLSSNMIPSENSSSVTQALRENRKVKKDFVNHPPSTSPPASASDLSMNSESKSSNKQQEGKNSTSPSVLNAIEKLIEKSFDSRGRVGSSGGGGGNFNSSASAANTPIGSSILKRLGIDESVDYTKPLVDAQTINLLRSYHHHQQQANCSRRERSGSESSSLSERGMPRIDALTPEKKSESSEKHIPSARATPESIGAMASPEEPSDLKIKRELSEEEDGIPLPSSHRKRSSVDVKVEVKMEPDEEEVGSKVEKDNRESQENQETREFRESHQRRLSEDSAVTSNSVLAEDDEDPRQVKDNSVSPASSPKPAPDESPCRNSSASPASSDRSATSRGEKKSTGSLGALSSMFDNLSGGNTNASEPTTTSSKGTSHPLAALQKLCDKTETHHPSSSRSASHGSGQSPAAFGPPSTVPMTTSTGTAPGAILAFSWACNDAVVNSDSIMKCAFCDTPFISKGAYRHHLSKMHFVKDGVIPDPVALKSPSTPPSKSNNSSVASTSAARSPTQQNNFEESPHSKFLKYTELAKQLSSKYV